MKIGILTGGGDTQALNSILFGAAAKARQKGIKLVGFERGWKGIIEAKSMPLASQRINPNEGGTFLRSSRKNPDDKDIERALENLHDFQGLVAVGGDNTLSAGIKICQHLGIPYCFVSKTIDNDVGKNSGSDFSFQNIINYFNPGFPTAARRIAQFARDLRTTCYSHDRIMFLEAMGRTAGWLSLASFSGNPDFVVVPEVELDYPSLLEKIKERKKDKDNVLIVVSEGAREKTPIAENASNIDEYGNRKLGGAAAILALRTSQATELKCDYVNPGLLYRAGQPCRLDKKLGILLGRAAIASVARGEKGKMAVIQRVGNLEVQVRNIENVFLRDASGKVIPRTLDLRFYDNASYSITELGKEYFRPILGEP